MSTLKLLAVFAHPDDESMGVGATLAKYAAEGVETHLVCASRGERGWSGPAEQYPGLEGLGKIRTKELEEAVAVLGMNSLYFLGYLDGDVDQANPSEAIGRIVTHIRRIQPQVMVTFGHDGIYGHPDHIAIGQFTTAAIVCAADASYVDPEHLPAYRISKLYYMVDTEDFVNLAMPYFEDMSFPVDDQVRSENPWKEWMVTTRLDITDYCRMAWRAIKCHASQKASLGGLADLDEETVLPILAKQGTYYRAFSLVNGGRNVETDLFEGLR
jgi:LmbE family N-acetylglucosaminyl deacetylase